MKIHLKSFSISFTLFFGVLLLVLSVWSRLSLTFGGAFMEVFNSIHPNPYAPRPDLLVWEQAAGVAFDVFYAVVDSLLFSLSFAFLYNKLLPKDSSSTDTDDTDAD